MYILHGIQYRLVPIFKEVNGDKVFLKNDGGCNIASIHTTKIKMFYNRVRTLIVVKRVLELWKNLIALSSLDSLDCLYWDEGGVYLIGFYHHPCSLLVCWTWELLSWFFSYHCDAVKASIFSKICGYIMDQTKRFKSTYCPYWVDISNQDIILLGYSSTNFGVFGVDSP